MQTEQVKQEAIEETPAEATPAVVPPRVADLTVDEFRALIHSTIEAVFDAHGLLDDPDEGLELRPEFVASLQQILASEQEGRDAAEVFPELALEG